MHRDGFFFDNGGGRRVGGGGSGVANGWSRSGGGSGSTQGKDTGLQGGRGRVRSLHSVLWSALASERWTAGAATATTTTTLLTTDRLQYTSARPWGDLGADVLLLFGANDPWCTPAIAKRMHAAGLSNGKAEGGGGGRRQASSGPRGGTSCSTALGTARTTRRLPPWQWCCCPGLTPPPPRDVTAMTTRGAVAGAVGIRRCR